MLSGTELVDWMALSRVHTGRVTRCRGEYLDAGHRIPGHLAPGLLFDTPPRAGLITLAPPEEDALALTGAGRARHQRLRTLRGDRT